jgi:hypothetical protein
MTAKSVAPAARPSSRTYPVAPGAEFHVNVAARSLTETSLILKPAGGANPGDGEFGSVGEPPLPPPQAVKIDANITVATSLGTENREMHR